MKELRYMKSSLEVLLNKAENDYIAARNLLSVKGSPAETIAFHVQQMVEKLLKVFLISKGIEYKPTHDLFYLIEKAKVVDPSFIEYEEISEELAPYAVLVRYEEGFDISESESAVLFERTMKLREKILASVKLK